MNTPLVYRSLFRLALAGIAVSFQVTVFAANTGQSPGRTEATPLAQAETAFKNGDYNTVTDLLWKNIDKLDRKALVLLAVAHEKKKEPAHMIKVANILTSKDPKDYEGFYLLGSAHLMRKKSSEALEALKTSLEINPKYQPAYERLAEMYVEKKNNYELRILYQDMLEQLGRKVEFLTQLCKINTEDHQEDQALSNCKEAIQKDPKVADNYVHLGLVQKQAGDIEKAKKSLKIAADTHSKSEFAQYTYAALLEEQKNYLESDQYFARAVKADPKSARSWLGHAKSSFELRKYEPALEAFKHACKLDRKNAVAFRKATTALKSAKDTGWTGPFEKASESCSGY